MMRKQEMLMPGELIKFLGMNPQRCIIPPLPVIPERKKAKSLCGVTDKEYWLDEEYMYLDIKKKPLPGPPTGGARGKRAVIIRNVDHQYHEPFHKMAFRCGEFYGMYVCALSGGGSYEKQTEAVRKAVKMNPDLILYMPVNQEKSTEHVRMIYEAGIPVFGANVQASREGMSMEICHTGPDEWTMARALAREVSKQMGGKGGLCLVTHFPGGPAYNARTYGFISELKDAAPRIEILDTGTAGFGSAEVEDLASQWIEKWGYRLNAIITAESFGPALGVSAAVEKAGRDDILLAGMDNNSVSMKLVGAGRYHCCTLQSSALDGALAMSTAARWLEGEEVAPVTFLPTDIITVENISEYMPPEW